MVYLRQSIAAVIALASVVLLIPFVDAQVGTISSGTWQAGGVTGAIAAGPAAAVLADGRILVAGRTSVTGTASATVAIYNPVTGTWTSAGSLLQARTGHTATTLASGLVLIAGGKIPLAGGLFTVAGSFELFNPATGTSTAVTGAGLAIPRSGHAAARLLDGRVLFVGGANNLGPLDIAEIYDPATNTVSPVSGQMLPGRSNLSATTLADGRVLVAGGRDSAGSDLAIAQIFDPALGTFSAIPAMGTPRSGHAAVLLPANNNILIFGGASNGTSLSSAETYDAATGAWTTAASMAAPRVGGFAAATSDGGAVAIGGGPTSAEFYRFVAMSSGSSGTPGGTGGGTSTPGGTSPSATSPAAPGQLLDFPLTGHPSIPGSGGTFGYPFIELTNSVLDHVHQNELFGETTWNASTQALTMKMYPQWLTFASAPFWYQAGSLAQSTDENLAISPCNQPGTFTDINHNGVRDFWEDTNGNGVLDPGEDMNGNGILDLEPPIECGRFEVHAQVDGQGQLVGAGTSTDVLMRGHIIKEHFDSTLLQWITDVNLNGTLLTGRIVEFGSQNPSSDAVLSSFCPFGSSKQADGLCHAADGSTSTPMCQAGFSANADGSCHSRAGRFTFRVLVTGGLLVDPTGPGCVQPSCFINIPGDVLDRNLDLGIDIKTANISGSFASGAISGYASGTAGTIPRVSGLSPTTTTLTLEPGPYTYRGTPFTATAAATASDGLHVEIPVVYTGDCTNVTAAGCTATATFHGDSTHADSSATQTITIVPRPITFRADDVTRIYAETTPAFGYSVSAGSIIGGDTFGAPIFTPDGINAGSHSIVLSGLSNPDYAISFAPGTLTVTPRALGVTALGEDKIYDGTTSATVTLGDNRIPTDSFTTSYVSASFADKNAGVAKTIQVAGISISGIDAANYTVNTSTTTNADIAPRSLVVSAAGVNKVYNGTTAATVTLNDDRVAGDILTTTYAAANFGDRNVGNGKAVSVTGIGLGGPDAGNYTANTTASTTANITARPLVVSATGVNKVYDGTTAAHVTLSDDRVTGDDITTSYASASFADANAGTAKPVSVAGISIAGTSAANYAANATATTTADITARPLTVTAAGVNKVYDGTTAAGVTLSDNRLSGDVLTASYGSANFADKHAGVAKAVSVAGITLTGAAAHNYAANATAATTADITPRSLTIAAAGVNKVYDGTPAATVTLSDNRVSGDLFTDAYTSAVFADARVGVGKPVDVTGISINGADAGNYNVNATASAVAHITPKAASVTPNTASKTYGTADPALTGTLAGFLAGDSVTASYTRAAGETVAGGPYAISATLTPAGVLGNYTVTYNTANFTITKASASVTPAAASKTYGTADPAFAGTLTGFRASDGVTASYTRVAGETVAGGPYAISATLTPAGVLGNYTVTYNTANFTITRASASVTPAAASKTYGTADPAFTGTLNGFLASDGVTASYTRAAGETVAGGPYAISAALNPASVLGNYTVTYNTANFTITRATASVTPNAASKTYGTADPAFTGTLTGFRASDSVTASYTRAAGETVAGGPYAISATLTPASVLGNYTITYNTAAFTVTKASASVTPAAASKTYGTADPTFAGTLTGFLASDGVTASYTRAAGETVAGGPYAISATLTPAGVLGNYTITYNTAAFTITKATASVTPAAASKTYGTADPPLTGTLAGFQASDSVTASYSRVAGETVAGGPYSISATLSPAGVLGNYTITYNTAAFTITKATASVTPAAASKTYGTADPAFTGTLTGFRASDSVTASYSRVAGETVAGGPYSISATLTPAGVLGNYTVTYNTANFTITRASASVTPAAASKTYGTADPALTGTLAGFQASDSVTASYSRVAGETVAGGPYSISATLTPAGVLGNYTITYNTAAFTITKATASVTPNAASKIYGTADPTLTGTLAGFQASDSVTASYSRVAGETVAGGPYSISATLTPAGVLGNYTITYNTAAFTITKATASVTPNAASKIYGTADPTLTGTLAGFLASDSVTASYSRVAGETVAGGPYAISATLTPGTVLDNYTVTYNTANFTITKATASVSATGGSFTYNGAAQAGSGSATGGRGESLPVTLSYAGTGTTVYGPTATAPANAGSYTVVASTTGDGNNAGGSSTPAPLTINKAAATVTLSSLTRAFTGTPLTPTATTTPAGLAVDWTGAPQTNAGSYPVTATINDRNYQGSASGTFVINPAAATATSTLAVSNLQPQYSDQDTFTVTVTSSAPGQPAAGVNFFVGSQQVGSPTPVTVPLVVVGDPATSTTYKAVWTGQLLEPTPTGQMKPGTHIVTAAFVNPNFTVTAPAGKSVNIVREDARLAGLDRTSYSLGGSATGVIPLTVTVKDISAMVGDAAFDAFAGDIRNAQVQFIDRATNTAIGTATVNALVGPGTTTGTATLNWSVNLGTATSKSYTIGFAVVNYYTRSNQTADNVVITVSR